MANILALPPRADTLRRLARLERRRTVQRLRSAGYWSVMAYLAPVVLVDGLPPLSLAEACERLTDACADHNRYIESRSRLRVGRYFVRHARAIWSKDGDHE